MGLKLYPEENIQAIATAIRGKNGLSTQYKTSEMAAAITAIPAGGLQHVSKLYEHTFYLKDTGYSTWTPSGTASAIISGASAGTFTATDIATTPYIYRTLVEFVAVYNTGTSPAKGMLLKVVGANWNFVGRRSSNLTNIQSSTLNYNLVETLATSWQSHYYSTASATSIASGTSYGIYPANVAGTVSSTSVASPTITVNYPTINARTSSTYFSTTMAGAIDQTNSYIKMRTDVYKVLSGYSRNNVWLELDSVFNNGMPTA